MKIPTIRMAALCLLLTGSASAEPTIPASDIPNERSEATSGEPVASRSGLIIPTNDVLSSHTTRQDGREITIQKIKPIALPVPPNPPPLLDQNIHALQARLTNLPSGHRESKNHVFHATVYRSAPSDIRSLFTYQPELEDQPMVSFWSSIDASLLQFIPHHEGTDSILRSFLIMWSIAGKNSTSVSAMPALSEGPATFTLLTGDPSAETIASIQALHDIYNQIQPQLLASFVAREEARLAREQELNRNPGNIVLSHWDIRTGSAAEGGNK